MKPVPMTATPIESMRITSRSALARQSKRQEGMVRRHGEFPLPHRTRHHIEIVKIEAMRRADRVIAFWYQHHAAVRHRHSLVERTVVGIDALKGKTRSACQAMIVTFFEIGLARRIVGIVLVWRITRPMAAWGDDFDDQQAFGPWR